MLWAAKVIKFIFNVVVFLGALACVLEYLKVKPEELQVGAGLPHGVWLIAACFLFALGFASSVYALYRDLKHPSDKSLVVDWPEAFTKPNWEIVSDHSFTNRTVELDGKSFRDCKFHNVTFVFHGRAPVDFTGANQFSGSFSFDSDNPAINTFSKLQRFARSIPGAKIAESAVDAKGNWIADGFKLTPVPLPTPAISPSDPRINVSILDEREGGYPQTPFVLHNQGKDVAHRVQLLPLKLRSGEVVFDSVDSIPADKVVRVVPKVSGSLPHTPLMHKNIVPLLNDQWSKYTPEMDFRSPLIVPGAVTYSDFSGKAKFETTFELVYWGLRDSLKANRLHPYKEEASVEIRNVVFRRLPQQEESK